MLWETDEEVSLQEFSVWQKRLNSVGGFVAGAALTSAADMPEALPRELIAAMHKHQARPEALHVRRDDVAAWLEEISRSLGIPLLRKDGLPQAEAAHKALREAMKLGPAGRQ